MKSLFFFLSAVVIVFSDGSRTAFAKAASGPRVRSGITTTVTSKFFQEYRNDILSTFEQQVKAMKMPDHHQKIDVGLVTVGLVIQKQEVKDFTFDMEKSTIEIRDGKESRPSILINIRDLNIGFTMHYNILSRPDFVRDEGDGSIRIDRMNISIKLTPYSDKGHLQFEFWDAFVEVEDYGI